MDHPDQSSCWKDTLSIQVEAQEYAPEVELKDVKYKSDRMKTAFEED